MAAQSLYTSAPGAFVAVGTFGPQKPQRHDVAVSAELGYRFGTGLDFSLGIRHAALQITELDFGLKSSAWELRPELTYQHPLGLHAVLRVSGLLNARFYRQSSGGFSLGGGERVTSHRTDVDLSALLLGRARLSEWLTIYPGAGLFRLRTLSERTDADCLPAVPIEGRFSGCGLPASSFEVRSTGVQFILPVALHLGERHLVLSPSLRYALIGTYPVLEPVADLSLRFNF